MLITLQLEITRLAGLPAQHEEARQAESAAKHAPSPPPATAAGVVLPPTAAQRSSSLHRDAAARFGIHPLPSPSSTELGTPPTPHIGLADTQSIASAYSPQPIRSRLGFNPEAREFDGSRAMLRRGQAVQPEAHDPMVEPAEREPGVPGPTAEQRQRRSRAAVRHLAMAYRYLTAADEDEVANRYNTTFTQDLGNLYTDEVVRVIQMEPDDPSSEHGSEVQGQDRGENDDEQWG